jgi:hypothetical protein
MYSMYQPGLAHCLRYFVVSQTWAFTVFRPFAGGHAQIRMYMKDAN